ncbi:MAG: glucose-6-phosphate dehydrogenase [bacterium]|nr:glucose-6-phosphate dehydrogenase [bacterium]
MGDLTHRKLVPALYNLMVDGLLPESFAVVGTGRRRVEQEEFKASLREGIEAHSRRTLKDERWARLESRLSYCAVGSDGFADLATHLDEVDARHGTQGRRLYYLATPPSAYGGIIDGLGGSGLNRASSPDGWARIVLEKPIGHDLASARALNLAVNRVFHERDVFRIDHYLGKETVQNLLVFRFANAIFEPLWNQKYVDHVQITVSESIGVGSRGAYFEEAGMARDMLQNHMFQLLCLIAMEPPVSLAPDAIRDEKVKVLQSLRPIAPEEVDDSTVRGQYAEGTIDGEAVAGYADEPGVAHDSMTETYVAARLQIDNWRWAGVPFYLRAGKRMNRRLTEVAMQFREVPHRLFRSDGLTPNTLVLRIQPDEGISLTFDGKVPGAQSRIRPVDMDFLYGTSFDGATPEAYERLLLDAMLGDSTLFIRRDEVEGSWAWVDGLHEGWGRQHGGTSLPEYTAGTWGPAEAHVMLARDGRTWRRSK